MGGLSQRKPGRIHPPSLRGRWKRLGREREWSRATSRIRIPVRDYHRQSLPAFVRENAGPDIQLLGYYTPDPFGRLGSASDPSSLDSPFRRRFTSALVKTRILHPTRSCRVLQTQTRRPLLVSEFHRQLCRVSREGDSLGKLWYDAVAYGPEELEFVSRIIERAKKFRGTEQVGSERILFGTDHPFFPPLSSTDRWMSVLENLDSIDTIGTWSEAQKGGVCGKNAMSLLDLGST